MTDQKQILDDSRRDMPEHPHWTGTVKETVAWWLLAVIVALLVGGSIALALFGVM